VWLQVAKHDLKQLDFEGILNYFRESVPKRFQSEESLNGLFRIAFNFKVKERKLKELERDYPTYLEQQAELEDPVRRLEGDNKHMRDTIMKLEKENEHLTRELVGSKAGLREEMDKLEERIDTLSKEARAHKTASEAAQILIAELREELQQAKEEYQKVMVQLMEERVQNEATIAEYKQLAQQMDESHQKQVGELNQELIEVKASGNCSPTRLTHFHI
jgi:chromosome segregation ATPase